MRIARDTEPQTMLLKENIDANEKKKKVEEDLRTADERSKLCLENAARKEIETYKQSRMQAATKGINKNISVSQLSLEFDEIAVSTLSRTASRSQRVFPKIEPAIISENETSQPIGQKAITAKIITS